VGSVVRPPEVPNIAAARPGLHGHEESSFSLLSAGVEEGEEDELGGAVMPLSLAQFDERRPMFFTFLIFGLTEGLHANTIMVAAYDAEARQGYILSIPRDSRVDFARNRRKIVSAYLVGRLNGGGHEGGVARMKHEVSTLVGFKPDFYISVDYEAFVRIVDAVGGVEVYTPFHMIYDDPFQNLHINIPAGMQLLDGKNALRFSRYRLGNDRRKSITDYQRIENQQQVLTAVARELLTPAAILAIPEFISIFNEYVHTDLSAGELLWFANQARNIGGIDALSLYTLPMLGTSGAPGWYEMPDESGILELVNRTLNPLVRDITSDDLRIVR